MENLLAHLAGPAASLPVRSAFLMSCLLAVTLLLVISIAVDSFFDRRARSSRDAE